MINVTGVHHYSVLVKDLSEALPFYTDVLGLEVKTSRPDFPFNGVWLACGAQEIHLMELPSPYEQMIRPEHGGRDFHVALQVSSLPDAIATLEAHHIEFTTSHSGRAALFCRDSDNNAIELIEPAS